MPEYDRVVDWVRRLEEAGRPIPVSIDETDAVLLLHRPGARGADGVSPGCR